MEICRVAMETPWNACHAKQAGRLENWRMVGDACAARLKAKREAHFQAPHQATAVQHCRFVDTGDSVLQRIETNQERSGCELLRELTVSAVEWDVCTNNHPLQDEQLWFGLTPFLKGVCTYQ
jgi:hypothetical protein